MKKVSVMVIVAVALLSADSATADLGLPSTPTLPPVPTVTSPKILDPILAATPSAPQLPSNPSLPSVSVPPVPVPAVPNVSGGSNLPSLPVRPPSTSTGGGGGTSGGNAPGRAPSSGGSGSTSGGGSGGSTGSGGGGAGSGGSAGSGGTTPSARGGSGTPGAGTPAADKRTAVQRRERRLRKTVQRLQGCLGSLSRLERRVLVLRAGIGAGGPWTRTQVARRLDVSARRVTRLEHRGVRELRGLGGAGRCGTSASVGGQAGREAPAAGGSPIVAAIQGPLGAGPRADRVEVKSEKRSSGAKQPDETTRGTRNQSLISPRARILGVDLTLPLIMMLGCVALVWAVRAVRRAPGPGPLA